MAFFVEHILPFLGGVLLGVGIGLAVLFAVLLVRTLLFRPKRVEKKEFSPISFDREAAVEALAALVRCKTVSNRDRALEDDAEFEKLISLLPTLYPNVARVCTFKRLPDRAILFHWQGKSADEPAVLMAHYDVVPVEEENWKKPPFDAILEDGVLWGRGTLDTKVTMNGALFAADHLIAEGFVPARDVYFAFSGGEEVNGEGAVRVVDYFEEHGIVPGIVVDEGGAVVKNVFPGVKAPCGMIGIAEKGMLNLEYRVTSNGGHASAPKPHTPVGELSAACCRLEKHPFKGHLTKPVAAMFDTLGRHSTFLYRMIFANLWCFGGLLDKICRKSGGELNALMRTTVAFTQMQGSKAPNVIPPSATMVSNMRLNPADTVESAIAYVKKTIDNENITLTAMDGMNPSTISVIDCEAWQKVVRAVEDTWQGTIVTPYLMVQCSDCRHWGRLSDKVYRFSAMDLTSEERATIHGNNERIRVETVARAVEFYLRLEKQL
ncbi:MAG: M20/M25/M40 family metallo-hydrolase [Ruminococcaceae bacterium]|nr:M20/M25/M40 family metallo-hydrolase [Oscillospiraceae bacterium]